jgi:hypothetical protein
VSGIDWNEDATLYLQLPVAGGTKTTRALQFGPLHWVITLALSGRHGPLSVLLIETESGFVIESDMIEKFARKQDHSKPDLPL